MILVNDSFINNDHYYSIKNNDYKIMVIKDVV